jgi:hypothetical protein
MCISLALVLPITSASAAESGQVQDPAVLSTRIDELTKQVQELSRLVAILKKQSQSSPGTKLAEPKPEVVTTQAQAPSAEQNATAWGPLRFSGDFRLRLDGTFRPALDADSADCSIPHVQNVRGRYRLRLNIDAGVHPKVFFHVQLATGTVNVPTTMDQDFSGIATHHPFMISEAWVDFHPSESVSVQGAGFRRSLPTTCGSCSTTTSDSTDPTRVSHTGCPTGLPDYGNSGFEAGSISSAIRTLRS